jgi:hypothetical protein
MARIKILPADTWFSKCVRERTHWVCEHCGTQYEEGSQGLHCSHLFGRRAYATRFDANNAFAHCFGCHMKLGSNPIVFTDWAIGELGEGLIELLTLKHNDSNLGKSVKKELKDVAKHYKAEHEKMKQKRTNGEQGRIEFISYV